MTSDSFISISNAFHCVLSLCVSPFNNCIYKGLSVHSFHLLWLMFHCSCSAFTVAFTVSYYFLSLSCPGERLVWVVPSCSCRVGTVIGTTSARSLSHRRDCQIPDCRFGTLLTLAVSPRPRIPFFPVQLKFISSNTTHTYGGG